MARTVSDFNPMVWGELVWKLKARSNIPINTLLNFVGSISEEWNQNTFDNIVCNKNSVRLKLTMLACNKMNGYFSKLVSQI